MSILSSLFSESLFSLSGNPIWESLPLETSMEGNQGQSFCSQRYDEKMAVVVTFVTFGFDLVRILSLCSNFSSCHLGNGKGFQRRGLKDEIHPFRGSSFKIGRLPSWCFEWTRYKDLQGSFQIEVCGYRSRSRDSIGGSHHLCYVSFSINAVDKQ